MQLREKFMRLDKNYTGKILKHEFESCLQDSGLNTEEIRRLSSEFMTDNILVSYLNFLGSVTYNDSLHSTIDRLIVYLK